MSSDAEKRAVKLTVGKMTLLAIAMFAFCFFVLPPLYNLFCEVTGLNGKTSSKPYSAVSSGVDSSRTVRVKFIATKNINMPWEFEPSVYSIDVHPGEAAITHFVAQNPTGQYMAGQAVPSMVPKNAIDYFHKTECFCFNQQILAPGETADLGLQFIVDQDLPKAVKTITLSYTLFDVSEAAEEDIEQVRSETEELKAARALPSFGAFATLTNYNDND
jgi:cytochrome c oxidase assembly protein subunit 11